MIYSSWQKFKKYNLISINSVQMGRQQCRGCTCMADPFVNPLEADESHHVVVTKQNTSSANGFLQKSRHPLSIQRRRARRDLKRKGEWEGGWGSLPCAARPWPRWWHRRSCHSHPISTMLGKERSSCSSAFSASLFSSSSLSCSHVAGQSWLQAMRTHQSQIYRLL